MTNKGNWFDYTHKLITNWLASHSIGKSEVKRVIDCLSSGTRQDRINSGSLQCPEIFCPGLRSQPWYDKNEFAWAEFIEKNFSTIQYEFDKIYSERNTSHHPENEKLAQDGVWGAFYFYRSGNAYPENIKKCPETMKIFQQIPGIDTAGSVFFSTLSPRSNIKPHYGPHNFRIRCHMGIIVPNDCLISVGNISKNWKIGKCIFFDDSFLHFVQNDSDQERMVLILDIWHPDLTTNEVNLLQYVMSEHIKLLKSGKILEQTPESVYEFM